MKYHIDYSKIFYPVADRPQEYIDTFEKRYENFDKNVIKEIFREFARKAPSTIKKSQSWGTSHVIYFVNIPNDREYVFRANNGETNPEEVMLAEKVITDKLARMNIPVNRVLKVDISRKKYPFDYQIEEKFEGVDAESIWKKIEKDRERCDYISFQIGELIAKMSELKLERFGLFDLKYLKQNNLVGYHDTFYEYIKTHLHKDIENQIGMFFSESQGERIVKLFEDRKEALNKLKPTIVHHDLADHNIAIDPETGKITALFDWESACSAHELLDLASCPTWASPYPREEKMLEGYKSVKGLPDNYEEIMNILRLRTVIWKNTFCVKAGLMKEKHVKRWKETIKPYGIKPEINVGDYLKSGK